MHIADSSGALREVVSVHIDNGSGWREVVQGWTSDASGTLRAWAGFSGTVTISVSAVSHTSFRVNWSSVDADTINIKVNGTTKHTTTSPSGNVVITGQTPTSTATVIASATRYGSTFTSNTVTYKLPNMPAPTSVSIGSITETSMTISWPAVSGATSYDIHNSSSGALLRNQTGLSWNRTGLSSGTAYGYYVRARFNSSVVSGASPVKVATTTATFKAGTYTFKASTCDTWQTSPASWRGTSDSEVYHGNGYPWSSRGGNKAYFFGYKLGGTLLKDYFDSAPATVVKVEVYVRRSSTSSGINSPQQCRWYAHNHSSQPGGEPSDSTDAYNNGTLDRGEGKWVTLPTSWGSKFLSGAYEGIVWGGTPQSSSGARYMIGPALKANDAMCQLRITIG